jgi:hypothetical protein
MQSPAIVASPLACPACNGPVDVKSRHVAIAGSAIRVFCSADCQRTGEPARVEIAAQPAQPRRSVWPHVFGVTVGLGLLALGGADENEPPPAPAPAAIAAATPAPSEAAAPAISPEEAARAAEDQILTAELMKDQWFHPLAGPKRRMPRNHNQAFGAERAGDRPAECFSGHCGVDVGGGLWGEKVRAVHDGVIERVNRGPNEERGGIYVKIAHRDATVFTQYFHLAAVPRWITPGTVVKAGQVIGLLGDTGVKKSAPHLHFAISVKPSAKSPERYLDPEPLISIWPLWLPDEDGSGVSRVSTHEPPGLPARRPGRGRSRPAPSTAAPANDEQSADTTEPTSAAEPPAPTGDEAPAPAAPAEPVNAIAP